MDDSLSESLRRVQALNVGLGEPSRDPISSESLRRIAEDRTAPSADRRSAFAKFSEQFVGEAALSEVILTFIDDPDIDVARDAIAAVPPFDGRILARLRQLLGDPRPAIWEASALALARKKCQEILPLMAEWARRGDGVHRRVGLSAVAFLLTPEPHLEFVESVCEDGPRDDADESVLVDALRVAEARVAVWLKTAKGPR